MSGELLISTGFVAILAVIALPASSSTGFIPLASCGPCATAPNTGTPS
jgi:hypothetical protein